MLALPLRIHHWLICLMLITPVAAAEPADQAPLRFGIVSPASASRVFSDWTPLVEELSHALGRRVEIVIPRGPDNILRHASDGSMDFFYVNSYIYYQLRKTGHAVPVVQMRNVEGNTQTQGRFVMREDDAIDSVDMLRGKRIALVSPMGVAAYLAPRAHLRELGIKVEEDMEIVFTQDPLKATYMVLHKEVDVAVMCSVNYRILERKLDLGELKIIDETVSFPEAVVAARPDLDRELVQRLHDILLGMVHTEPGRRALQPLHDLKVGSFVEYDPAVEQAIERLVQEAEL